MRKTILILVLLSIIACSPVCDKSANQTNNKFRLIEQFETGNGLYGSYYCTIVSYRGIEYMIIEQRHARGGLTAIQLVNK